MPTGEEPADNPTEGNPTMHRRPQQSSSSSYTKAIILLVALVLLVLVVNNISRQGLPRSLSDLLTMESGTERPFGPFTEEQKKTFMDRIVGFWSGERSDSAAWMGGRDMVELKDNGIVWRVIERWAVTPDGDTVRQRHTFDAYLRPFGLASGADSAVACDVRVLRQHRIQGGDTCFGPQNVDVVWLMKPLESGVAVNGMPLDAYDGDLAEFFPAGALDALEAAYEVRSPVGAEPAYELGKGKVVLKAPTSRDEAQVEIELPECPAELSFATFARDTIGSLLAARDAAERDSIALVKLVDTLYAVLLTDDLRELPAQYLQLAGTKVGVSLRISADGSVAEAETVAPTPKKPALRESILRHARAWRFPPAAQGGGDTVSLTWIGEL